MTMSLVFNGVMMMSLLRMNKILMVKCNDKIAVDYYNYDDDNEGMIIKCFLVLSVLWLCTHNNLYRTINSTLVSVVQAIP